MSGVGFNGAWESPPATSSGSSPTKERSPLKFRTVEEMRAFAAARPHQWLVHGLLAQGVVLLLASKSKVGKTTFLAALLAACERALEFAGFAVSRAKAVYLSEESAVLLVDRCDRFGVESTVFLSREEFNALHDFRSFIAAGVAECKAREASMLIVDTYARFARLSAEGEKDAGVTQEIMEAVLEAASQGIAVVLVTHLRKAEGEEGDAIRGSTALTGAADIIVELRRAQGEEARELRCYSRFVESPTEPVLLRLDGTEYVRLDPALGEGAPEEVPRRQIEQAKSAILRVVARGRIPRSELLERVPVRAKARQVALAELLESGAIVRSGRGRAGDPHCYEIPAAPTVPDCSGEFREQTPAAGAGVPGRESPPTGVTSRNTCAGEGRKPHPEGQVFPEPTDPRGCTEEPADLTDLVEALRLETEALPLDDEAGLGVGANGRLVGAGESAP